MIEVFNGAKVEVYLQVAGSEKSVKESFSDVTEGADGEKLLDFAAIMADLAPASHSLNYAVGHVATRFMR